VIDALNFPGYDDKSWTAKQQAMYTDLILINKHELVTDERTLDKTLDDVHELNPETPKVPLTKPSSLVRRHDETHACRDTSPG
jgi:G3E family GTPase